MKIDVPERREREAETFFKRVASLRAFEKKDEKRLVTAFNKEAKALLFVAEQGADIGTSLRQVVMLMLDTPSPLLRQAAVKMIKKAARASWFNHDAVLRHLGHKITQSSTSPDAALLGVRILNQIADEGTEKEARRAASTLGSIQEASESSKTFDFSANLAVVEGLRAIHLRHPSLRSWALDPGSIELARKRLFARLPADFWTLTKNGQISYDRANRLRQIEATAGAKYR